MATLLTFLATLLASLAKAWLANTTANNNAISLGETKQALATESETNVQIANAVKARSDFKPYSADDVRNAKPGTDANFRD